MYRILRVSDHILWVAATSSPQSSYTYSLVFAADMYATIFKADPLDPARGQKYREKILLPGGSQDDIESLKVITDIHRYLQFSRYLFVRTSLAVSQTLKPSSRLSLAIPRANHTCNLVYPVRI